MARLKSNMPKVGDVVKDTTGRMGVVLEADNPHNIRVKFRDGMEGFHCIMVDCSHYDPLELYDCMRGNDASLS